MEIEFLNECGIGEGNHGIPVTVELSVVVHGVIVANDRFGDGVDGGVRLQPELRYRWMDLQRRLRRQHDSRAALNSNRLMKTIAGKHPRGGADDDDVGRVVRSEERRV